MKIDGQHYRTIWFNDNKQSFCIIDQTKLPHQFSIVTISTLEEAAAAIKTMQVRGAPLIGVTAAYGFCLALTHDAHDGAMHHAYETLARTRPTAVNLRWALDLMMKEILPVAVFARVEAALSCAMRLANDDVETCRLIGFHGKSIIEKIATSKKNTVNILTHCNAGWLACVDWGTALSPVYQAFNDGIPVHVWVDETRPRNQGAALTAFELQAHGIPHTVITDNAGGHLMQHGQVDLCIVGCDRLTSTGDAANKIGTYLKALAAKDNNIPFYVALPRSTIDWTIEDGVSNIPIEERDPMEVTHIDGFNDNGAVVKVRLTPQNSKAANPSFDVTPARLITGLMTEDGLISPSRSGLQPLHPDRHHAAI